MTNFNKIIEFIFKWEGGLTDDPNDSGGLTNFGIDQASHPDVDIRNLTKEQAQEIYYNEYYVKNKIPSMPKEIQLIALDCAVNCGGHQMALWLQRALDVHVDGLIGNITLGKLHASDLKKVGTYILDERTEFYKQLAKRKHNQAFLKGWLNRVNDLRNEFNEQFV